MALKKVHLFRPKPTISDDEIERGLRYLTLEGMASHGFFSITTSGFLAAFALALGANNLQIGILAAIPFITQPLQLAVIPLVERIRLRKAMAIGAWIPAQLLWIPIALIPIFLDVPSAGAISLLLGLLAIRGVLTSINNCAWNSWIRDLIPQQILGNLMGRRLSLAAIVAIVFGLSSAFFADWWIGRSPSDSQVLGYTIPLLFGIFTLALVSPVFMAMIPEPRMQPIPEPKTPIISTIAAPFRDRNYRKLLRFLLLWGFAINLSTPFFAVYMLVWLELPLTQVIGFSVLSQVFNIIFLRIWGRFVDRFGHKAILSLCVSLYLLVILGWTFTTMPERYFLTIPLLVVLHILAGIAAAGVTLTVSTIGLKLSPAGRATPYLAGASIATSMGAGLGPLLGGFLADYFSGRQLGLIFEWLSPDSHFFVDVLNITGFDFLFVITFIIGLMTLPLLASVREEGESTREVVLEALVSPTRELMTPLSSVAGLNFLSQFPYGYIRRVKVPGIDVALGVTIFQIAEMARLATIAVRHSRRKTAQLTKILEEKFVGIKSLNEAERKNVGAEVARQAARGSMHAIEELEVGDASELANQTVQGVTKALSHSGVDSKDALHGAGYGVIQGTAEIKADLTAATVQAVEAAKKIASDIGLAEDVAITEVARGAIAAAEDAGDKEATHLKALFSEQIQGSTVIEPEEEGH